MTSGTEFLNPTGLSLSRACEVKRSTPKRSTRQAELGQERGILHEDRDRDARQTRERERARSAGGSGSLRLLAFCGMDVPGQRDRLAVSIEVDGRLPSDR
jgi:hypothetical protein